MPEAVAGDQVGHDRPPAHQPARGGDHDVEQAVVDLRVGHELRAGGQLAAVADDHGAGVLAARVVPVGDRAHPEAAVEQHLRPGHHVGDPPEALLHALVDLGHRLGVEPDARRDEEDLDVAVVERDPPDVDALGGAGQHDPQGLVEVERQPEVAGQQVAGASRQQAQRHLGLVVRRALLEQALDHRAHRPVSAEGAHDARAVADGLLGLADARVLDRGLVPGRGGPALLRAGLLDLRAHGVGVVELAGIDDQRDAACSGVHPSSLVGGWSGGNGRPTGWAGGVRTSCE